MVSTCTRCKLGQFLAHGRSRLPWRHKTRLCAQNANTSLNETRGVVVNAPEPLKVQRMSNVQRIFITRHGERQDMVDETWHTTAEEPGDPPLTKQGLEQAAQLAQRLKTEDIKQIYASPFLRTVQTAHQVASIIHVPVKVEYGLSEGLFTRLFPHGEPRMLSLEDLQRQMELVSVDWCSVHGRLPFPEEKQAVEIRVQKALQQILERHPNENILFVGHGLSVHYLVKDFVQVRSLLSENSSMSNIPYCALTELVRERGSEKWKVIGLWDDEHIQTKQDKADLENQARGWED